MQATTLLQKTARTYRVTFVICLLGYLFGGLASTLMSVYLPVVIDQVAGPVPASEAGRIGAYINALFLFGWMLGGIGFGLLGDRLGRVRSFLAAVGLYGACMVLTGLKELVKERRDRVLVIGDQRPRLVLRRP